MKVNSFKFPNSKRPNSYSLHQLMKFPNTNIVELQEPINDYCRPICIFNSQVSTNGFNDQLRYQQIEINESLSKNDDNSLRLKEHIIDQPMKGSSMSSKEKTSSVFTNADSKSNYSKEINEISPTGSESHIQGQDSTLLSIMLSNNSLCKGNQKKTNCTCPHRHSFGLNTKELIRITNQRKVMLTRLEEKEREKRKNSHDMNAFDHMQYNSNDHAQGLENELDNVNFEEDPVFTLIKASKEVESVKNEKDNEESCDFNIQVDKERFNKNENEDDMGNLDFQIENRCDDIRSNRNDSDNDEYLFSQNENEPYKVTNTTQKEIETEINEFDIDKNKGQNETRIMFKSNETSPLVNDSHSSPTWLNQVSPQRESQSLSGNNEGLRPQSNNFTSINSPQLQILPQESNEVILQKLNFFEETLKKIQLNEDKVNSYNANQSKPVIETNKKSPQVKYDNNRYEKKTTKKDQMIPHPMASSKLSASNTKPKSNHIQQQQGAAIHQKSPEDNKRNLQISKPPADNRGSIKQESKTKRKRYSNNYSELYTKKSVNDSGVIANKPINKSSSTKVINKSNSGCDILLGQKSLYSQRLSQKESCNHITRNHAGLIMHYDTSDAVE